MKWAEDLIIELLSLTKFFTSPGRTSHKALRQMISDQPPEDAFQHIPHPTPGTLPKQQQQQPYE